MPNYTPMWELPKRPKTKPPVNIADTACSGVLISALLSFAAMCAGWAVSGDGTLGLVLGLTLLLAAIAGGVAWVLVTAKQR